MPTLVDSYVHREKTAPVDMLAPNKNRDVTYQTDRNHISKTIGYLVGVVILGRSLQPTKTFHPFFILSLKWPKIVFW